MLTCDYEIQLHEYHMSGESNLSTLLQNMTPILHEEEYGFGFLPNGSSIYEELQWFALMREDEAITVVATVAEMQNFKIDHIPGWARISLEIHSDLAAVGLTAAVSTALTKANISANVVAGYYHDHFFVQWERRHDAMAALRKIGED
jgi:uncharacterized protein